MAEMVLEDVIWTLSCAGYQENGEMGISESKAVCVAPSRILTAFHNLPVPPICPSVIATRLDAVLHPQHYLISLEYAKPEFDMAILRFADRSLRFPNIALSANHFLYLGDELLVVDQFDNLIPIFVIKPCIPIHPQTFRDINSYVFNEIEYTHRTYALLGDVYPLDALEHPNMPIILYDSNAYTPGRSGAPLVRNGPNGYSLVGLHISHVSLYDQPICGVGIHISAITEFLVQAQISRRSARDRERARRERMRERARRERMRERARERARRYPGFSRFMRVMRCIGPVSR